ncbi:MAG: efflux RND transporter periplasmic adaptor subunit [Verrucomicrobiaceae bacterium]|nr:MAG: efflux RND transporter periplasmic adaptor subunit [Verrucomicrobiaceae bacterium]
MKFPALFSSRRPGGFHVSASALLGLLLLAGCRKKDAAAPGAGMGGPAGPTEVGVLTVATAPVTLTQNLPGRVSAFRVAEVRARVNGIVLKRHFDEGADVKEGQLLYEIDPAPYQAALDSANATLARGEANAAAAESKEKRFKQLLSSRAVSQQDYNDALAARLTSAADIQAAKATIQSARIDLEYTKVTAPISGRIGISQVTEGAYVQSSNATLMATIQQLDPVYVDVTQATSQILQLKQDLANGRLKADKAGLAEVRLLFDNGQLYPEMGRLQTSDVTVNPSSNSVTVRVVFPNPKRDLLPGMFVRARLEEGNAPDAILVPQLAVTRNTRGEPTAMVVGAGGKVEVRVLRTTRTVGNQWLVTSGLKPGDQVIVNNLQKLRPGADVKPAPADAVPAAPAQAGAGGGTTTGEPVLAAKNAPPPGAAGKSGSSAKQ